MVVAGYIVRFELDVDVFGSLKRVRMARLQIGVGTKDFFEAQMFSRKMLRNFPPREFLSLNLVRERRNRALEIVF